MIKFKYPTFIHVANLRDLFWNNNSDLYPTTVPGLQLYTRVSNTRPIFETPYMGTCILEGELNHCYYDGVYYFLTKLEVLDITRNRFKYQLDYDVMINFIANGGEVRGTLVKTNDIEILDEVLQTTKAILTDPATTHVFNSLGKTAQWQQTVEIKFPTSLDDALVGNVIDWVSKPDFDSFVQRVNKHPLGEATKDKEWLPGKFRSDGYYEFTQTINPIIFLDQLKLCTGVAPWARTIYRGIEKLLDKKEELVITKLTSVPDHYHSGNYVIGRKDETLGRKVAEDVTIQKIDLSGLREIRPVDNRVKGKEREGETIPEYKHLYESNTWGINKRHGDFTPFRVVHSKYLPISTNNAPNSGMAAPAENTINFRDHTLWDGKTWQRLRFRDGGEGGLWFAEKTNVALIENIYPDEITSHLRLSTSEYQDRKCAWHYFSISYDKLPPLGFLLFQLRRQRAQWRDFEFTGDELNQFEFRTGLNLYKYKHRWWNEWWSYVDSDLLRVTGNAALTRALLDLDKFGWMTIAPSYVGYRYKYYWGNYWGYLDLFPDAGNEEKYYPSTIQRYDIVHPAGRVKNTFTEDLIEGWLADRERKLNEMSIYISETLHDTDYKVKRGDLVFSALEHTYVKLDKVHLDVPFKLTADEWNKVDMTRVLNNPTYILDGGQTQANYYHFTNRTWATYTLLDNSNKIEEGGRIPAKGLCFCLYKGKYQLMVVRNPPRISTIFLSSDLKNDVAFVNDGRAWQPIIDVVSPVYGTELDYKTDTPFNENIKRAALSAVLGVLSKSNNDRIHFFDDETLAVGVYTFELVGTQWSLLILNGKYHLFPTNPNLIVGKTLEPNAIVVDMPSQPSTYAKINQKAEFVYYGQSIPLNTKFTFRNHKFNYKVTPITLEQRYADPDVEYKHLEVTEPNDYFNMWLTLPKKETRAAEQVDSSRLMMLKERIMSQVTNYEQDRYKNELLIGDKRLAMARQREDLDFQYNSTAVSLGLKVGGLVLGGLVGRRIGGVTGAVTGVAGAAASMKGDIETLIRYPTLANRINEDEINLMLANAQLLYQRKQNYEHDFRIQTYKLNQQTNTYVNPGVTNRDAQEGFNKMNNYTDVNIQVRLPSPDQQREIDYIYDTFGCECLSERYKEFPLIITNGMKAGLYRFSRLEVGGISTKISDPAVKDIVRQIFENGTKFLEVEHTPIQTEDVFIVVEKEQPFDFDKKSLSEWSREIWDRFNVTAPKQEIIKTIRELNNFGLTDEEYNRYKDRIRTDNDNDLLQDINSIIAGREGGTIIQIGRPPTPEDPEKTALQGQLDALQKRIESTEQKHQTDLSNLQSELDEKKTELSELENKLKVKEGELEAKVTELTELNRTKSSLEEELRKCKIDHQNVVNARDTCDLINANKIKELEAKLKQCEDRIKEKEIEIEASKRGLTANVTRYDELSEAYKRLEGEKTQQQNLANLYKEEAAKLRTELAAAKAKPPTDTQTTRKLRDAIKDIIAGFGDWVEGMEMPVIKIADLENITGKLKAAITKKREEIEKQTKECDQTINDYRSLVQTQCNIAQSLIEVGYDIDLKERESGGNALRDLVKELLLELKWMRRAELDTKLAAKYHDMRKIFNLLYKMQEIPVFAEWEDLMSSNLYSHYRGKQEGVQGYDETQAQLVEVKIDINKIRYETKHTAYGLKALLDELNFLCYEIHKKLKEELKTDTDLQYMFAHVYPGETLPLYKELFGDPNIGIRKNIFKKYYTCPLLQPENVQQEQFKYNTLALIGYGLETDQGTQIIPLPERQKDRKEGMYVHPMIIINGKTRFLSSRIEDVTVFFDPKYIPNNFDETQIDYIYPMTQITDHKTCYQFGGKNYSWKYVYAALSKTTTSSSLGVYFHVESSGIWNKIKERRQYFWQNERKNVKLDRSVDEYDWERYIEFLYWNKDGIVKTYTQTINLLDHFGEFYVLDAAFILAILNSFTIGWKYQHQGGYAYIDLKLGYGFRNYENTTFKNGYWLSQDGDMSYNLIDNILILKTTPKEWKHRRTYHSNLEFNSVVSVLNYIWAHIKNNYSKLIDPFGPELAKIGLGPLMDRVYKETQTC